MNPRIGFGVLVALIASALSVAAATAVIASPERAHTAAGTEVATVVVHVRPVDGAGHLLPGYRIARRFAHASCSFGSEATGTAYRCFAGRYLFDPCWVAANKRYVECLGEGWKHTVYRLHVTKGYENVGFSRKSRRARYPWGVQTVNGARCGLEEGASGTVGKLRINYGCGKTGKTVLIGKVDRTSTPWTIRKAVRSGIYHYKRDGQAGIETVWFGKSSRKG